MKNEHKYIQFLESAFINKIEEKIFSIKNQSEIACFSEGDYLVMGQNSEFLHHALGCLNVHNKKLDAGIWLRNFFHFNPEYKENINFLKGITHQTKKFHEFSEIYLTENKEYQEYIKKDYKFLSGLVDDSIGQIFYLIPELKNDDEFRSVLIDTSDFFRYDWFDLPIHTDLETLSKSLIKDPYAFKNTPIEIQKNIDVVLDILDKHYKPMNLRDDKMEDSMKIYFRQDYWETFYENLYDEIKLNKVLIDNLADWGFIKQDARVYEDLNVLKKTLDKYIENQKEFKVHHFQSFFNVDTLTSVRKEYSLKDLFKNKKNAPLLVNFIKDNFNVDKLKMQNGVPEDITTVLKFLSKINYELNGKKQIGFKVGGYTKKNVGGVKEDFKAFMDEYSKKIGFDYLKATLPENNKENTKNLKI